MTGVCSAANADLVTSIGAQRTIDYATQDFAQTGDQYDIVVDTIGNAPYRRSRGALAPGGRLALVLSTLGDLIAAPFISMRGKHKVIAGPTSGSREDLHFLAGLAESGAYRPVIDKVYRFDQMAEAHRRVESGRKRGNVVVTVNPA